MLTTLCILEMHICMRTGVSGNLVFDAQIVTLCLEHGVRIIRSNDRDFLRFREIEVQPLD